ncbi:MAG: deoxyribodipyrimidine photo-lyase [Flavobacterium sp.]|nr:deoxyribodipyrimidine photo-lyase [Pedobacter sp.]
MKQEVSVCWLRRDLRLFDNTALYHALNSKYPVLIFFIFDSDILDKLLDKKDRRVVFIHRNLHMLNDIAVKYGSYICVLHDQPTKAFNQICEQFEVKEVYANHDYEPYAITRDSQITAFLNSRGIKFATFKDQVIFEKAEVMKSDGTPYTVFTPYSKIWKNKYRSEELKNYPSEKLLNNLFRSAIKAIPSLTDIGFEDFELEVTPNIINEDIIKNYHLTRNAPSVNGTSYISVHLRFGTVSIRQLVVLANRVNETWLNELIWREFFMMILFNFPGVVNHSFKKKYDKIKWRNNETEFFLWCKGETGYPLVDAGMRQLNETGWMHNRVRLVVASFLCKHLLIDWRWGEAYFGQKLLDYDLSSNNGNWQWASGSGCDSAPYFRIFNPTEQTKKFDPKLDYIKAWIKDFNPHYLTPIVDHNFARKRALEVYKTSLTENEQQNVD